MFWKWLNNFVWWLSFTALVLLIEMFTLRHFIRPEADPHFLFVGSFVVATIIALFVASPYDKDEKYIRAKADRRRKLMNGIMHDYDYARALILETMFVGPRINRLVDFMRKHEAVHLDFFERLKRPDLTKDYKDVLKTLETLNDAMRYSDD